jgi:hypothetical protein
VNCERGFGRRRTPSRGVLRRKCRLHALSCWNFLFFQYRPTILGYRGCRTAGSTRRFETTQSSARVQQKVVRIQAILQKHAVSPRKRDGPAHHQTDGGWRALMVLADHWYLRPSHCCMHIEGTVFRGNAGPPETLHVLLRFRFAFTTTIKRLQPSFPHTGSCASAPSESCSTLGGKRNRERPAQRVP